MKVKLSPQVVDFIKTLAPEPRRRLRDALRELERGHGDVRALEREFEGFHRLRVGEYRIVFQYRPGKSGPECNCLFAESRDIVYETLAIILAEEGRL